jgi:hypothetical protein
VYPAACGRACGEIFDVGGFVTNSMNLNLNPGFADNNVMLSGIVSSNTCQGTWAWYGFTGIPFARGSCSAVKHLTIPLSLSLQRLM